MKKRLIYLSVILGGFTFIMESCLGFDCELKDNFEDFDNIESTTEATAQTIVLNVFTLEIDTLLDGKKIIIDDAATYDSLKVANENCELCFFPTIDFSQNTLVAVYYEIACEANAFAKMTKTDTGYKHYTKAINTSECSFLGCYNYSLRWHTIPKIDSSTTFETAFGESYNQCNCN